MAAMSGLRWVRIILCALAAFVSAFVSVFGFVTVYAVKLGIEAQGPPDQALIQAFAGKWAPIVGPIAGVVFAFLFAWLAARTPQNRFMHGVMTGAIYGGVSLVLGVLGGVDLGAIVTPILIVLAGAAAGKLAARNEPDPNAPVPGEL